MTPEEKAKELVEKFRIHCYCYLGSGMLTNTYNEQVQISNAKQCAIIAVDELLQIAPSVYVTKDEEIHSGHYQYWSEVKQEIEKL